MLKKFVFSVGAVLLLASAGFASGGYITSHAMFSSCHTAIIGCSPIAHSYCFFGAVGFQQQTFIVGYQHHVIQPLCWLPCMPSWNHHCNPQCNPPSNPSYYVKGGDAIATAVSYDGNADPTAIAIGGDAFLKIQCGPLYRPSCIVIGGDATATAANYGGNADAHAQAVGGDAIVIIK
ncbi:MAG: hypothetical protein A2173_00855 [Planctomycetes bacterium RBG_13_44_8b]|nr:MAG: hypothetical protein A2173_00855 [Planctomycetes bacterium RBG_13_44_8b]